MLRKMPGDRWQQLANLRAFLGYQWAHPGKQLIFMGTEFGQEAEWSEQHGLDWWLADIPAHRGLQLLTKDLNELYKSTPALYSAGQRARRLPVDQRRRRRPQRPDLRPLGHRGKPVGRARSTSPAARTRTTPWGARPPVRWTEVLNTDAATYGGSGVLNDRHLAAAGRGHRRPARHPDSHAAAAGCCYFKPAGECAERPAVRRGPSCR